MYFYEVGYGSPEDSSYRQIQHEKLFTEDEFDNLVLSCVPEALINYIKGRKSWGLDRLDKEMHINFSELHNHVTKILCNKHGFSPIKLTACFSTFGWADLIQDEGWDSYTKGDRVFQKLATTARNAYIDAGYWRDEDDYKYVWFEGYDAHKKFLKFIIKEANKKNISIEKATSDDKDSWHFYLRIPRADMLKLNVDSKVLYLGKQHGIYKHFYFFPLWYTKREFYNKYHVPERNWKIITK